MLSLVRRLRVRVLAAALAVSAISLAPASSAAAAPAGDPAAHGIPSIRVFRAEDGVPQSSVTGLAFEPGGRLWMGTQAGAAFYDGKRFTRLALPSEVASSIIRALLVARDGALWLGTAGGSVVRYAAGAFTHFDEASGLPSAAIDALVEATVGETTTVWVGTYRGLYRREGDRFVPVDLGPELRSGRVEALATGVLPAGEPGLWVGTSAGLARCGRGGCTVFTDDLGERVRGGVKSLLEAADEQGGRALWVGTTNGLHRYAGGRWESFTRASSPLPNDAVTALAQTVSGSGRHTLWVGTYGGGLARVRDGVWTTLDPSDSALPSTYVKVLAASDAAHGGRTLWVGTDGGGVARLRHDGWTAFTPRNAPLASGSYVETIGETTAADGTASIWLAPNEGLVRGTAGTWATVDLSVVDPAALFATAFTPLRGDPSALWIGTGSGAIGRWKDGRLTPLAPELPPSMRRTVHVVRESTDGRSLWVATHGGAARLVDGAWETFSSAGGKLPGDFVFTILETARPEGGITTWFGTNKGLARLEDGVWQTYDSTRTPMRGNEVLSLAEVRDARGARVLWIGTVNGGVARYDLDASAWRETLTGKTRPALPDDTVYGIRADARGHVYLFTNRGVARLSPRAPTAADPAELALYAFTTEDGLPGDECTGGTLLDSRGRIWAATVAGAAVFDPAEEVDDPTPKPLAALRARAGERDVAAGEALRWDDNSLSFDYALLSFFRERDTRYRIQLAGFDVAPSAWSSDDKARYTNLPPGEYTFQVWGRDYAGNEAGPASIGFRVRTAPWKTWWAVLGYALLGVGLVYGALRARLVALAERNRRLEARVQERTRELDRRVAELGRKNQELEASQRRADRIFSALADALPGTELDGKYRLEVCIGQGGFGAVFRARHLTLSRNVAVKVFRPAPGNDSASALARFQREGTSASRVSHPNAVQVFDAGVSREGIAYLVMELLDGRSLAEELRARGKIPPRRAARITAQVCAALEAAHAHGILHRDIKPENVFLHRGHDGEVVKVVDFGIAKLVGLEERSADLLETRGIVGSPSYMAPERFKGGSSDARSDVYSVGVTAFEMLSGTLPYPLGNRSILEQLMRQLADPPVALSSVAPGVPAEAARVIMACLAIDPAQRPPLQTLAEVFTAAVAPLPEEPPEAALDLERSPPVDALGQTVDYTGLTSPTVSSSSATVAAPSAEPGVRGGR